MRTEHFMLLFILIMRRRKKNLKLEIKPEETPQLRRVKSTSSLKSTQELCNSSDFYYSMDSLEYSPALFEESLKFDFNRYFGDEVIAVEEKCVKFKIDM